MANNNTNEYYTFTFTFNKHQIEKNEKLVETLKTGDFEGLVKRGLILASVLAAALEQEKEFFVVDKQKAQILKTENTNNVAILGKDKESIVNVTKEMEELTKYTRQIQESNAFGMPVHSIGNYALKNN